MNSANQVNEMVQGWIDGELTKSEIIWNTALAELGWDYVWGATGQTCVPSTRTSYMNRQIQRGLDGEAAETKRKCQVLSGKKSGCEECAFYPDGQRTLIDDCQGFVKQVCKRVGITFSGGGCTSMWNAKANWSEQGPIADMPKDKLCCVFWTDKNDKKVKSHIGFSWNGIMIHCSGSVKKETLSKKCTDYAIPKGLEGDVPVPVPPTLRKGSTGEDVVRCQQDLMKLNYDLSPYGADGKYGNKTAAAVAQFQKDNGLTADGVCGPRTWEKLIELAETAAVLYTVTIKHLTKYQAEALKERYDGAVTIEEETT